MHPARSPGQHPSLVAQRPPPCWETACSSVSWDYPPSLAAYNDALLSRGASHSRFLRIAYSSARERCSTPAPSSSRSPPSTSLDTSSTTTPPRKQPLHLPPAPPFPLPRPCLPRSAYPSSHTSKRRNTQWPKPPHYHASLLRSPLSRRKGLFRAVLPPNKAVDFFRWDILLGPRVALSAPPQERGRTRTCHVHPSTSLHVAESVLEPYEAAAGFFGWHGLGLDVTHTVEDTCYAEGVGDQFGHGHAIESYRLRLEIDGPGENGSSDLQLEIDEADVEEGRASWARAAEELVGPPGLVVGGCKSEPAISSATVHNGATGARASSFVSQRRDEVRWDSDIGTAQSRPYKPKPVSEKRPSPLSNLTASVPSKPELGSDSPSPWWNRPSPHRGPPPSHNLPSLCFPQPPPSSQYGLPSIQFSPWFPGGRVTSAQGHGYWYGSQPIGAPSPMSRDQNLTRSHLPHSHAFTTPLTPTSIPPDQSSRYPIKSVRGEYGAGHDCDKETETDHGYESTTTTTDSDPPPHTPIGVATTPHRVEELQIHGDDDVEVHDVEIDEEHAAACVTIATPVKLSDRFSVSILSSVSSDSPDSNRDDHESSKAAVLFPSLNGTFRQGTSLQMSVPLSGHGIFTPVTPARTLTSVIPSSLSFAKESEIGRCPGEEGNSEVELRSGTSSCFASGDSPAFKLSLCSPPAIKASPELRKDSGGFWEPETLTSPSSSSSPLPLSPSDGKTGPRLTSRWIGEEVRLVPEKSFDASETSGSQCKISAKSGSLSHSPHRVESAGPSSWRPATFSSPMSTPASASVFGGSHPSSPSPADGTSFPPLEQTTLLPAFLATTSVKRKKVSKTREIVDRLRSSSIDAGKEGTGLESLDWLAGSSADRGQSSPSPSPSPPSKSGSDSESLTCSDPGKKIHAQVSGSLSKSSDSGSTPVASGSGGKNNGMGQTAVPGSETLFSRTNQRVVTTATKSSVTPFPILSVSQTSASNFAMNHQSQSMGINGREPVATTPFNVRDGSRINATVDTSPSTRSSGAHLLPVTLNGGTSPSARPLHHPVPSPSRPAVHPPAPLGPPHPMLAVPPYPPPMYVSVPHYHLAPPQQGQGTWMAVYAGCPPHLPLHPIPAQVHVAPITGVSGMRHASW